MAQSYINYIKSKTPFIGKVSETPVLTEDDENFLNRITSDGDPAPPLPHRLRSSDAQVALMDGAQNIPLPETPSEQVAEPDMMDTHVGQDAKKPRSTWSWLRRDSRDIRAQDRGVTADSLMEIAGKVKAADAQPNDDDVVSDVEAKKEEDDMREALESLNLAAVDNRVFSVSKETQELLVQFNQVFKDLINGVPTAYHDLESLLTNGDKQLQKTYQSMPTFLQKLIEGLPTTMTKGFAPEMLAVAAERAGKSGINMQNAGKAAAAAKKMGFKTPSLKDLVAKPGAVAGMLRSIITYLRARFPAFLGMNVLWSLALFVLLFVFWYCHKRGREVRLENERNLTEKEVEKLDREHKTRYPDGNLSTTAPAGASMEEVQAGMQEVEDARAAAAELREALDAEPPPSSLSSTVQPAEKAGT